MSLVGGSGYLYEQGGMLIDSRCAEPCCGGGVSGGWVQLNRCDCPQRCVFVQVPDEYFDCSPTLDDGGGPPPIGSVLQGIAGECYRVLEHWDERPDGAPFRPVSSFRTACMAGCQDASCEDHSDTDCPPNDCPGIDLCDGYQTSDPGRCGFVTSRFPIIAATVVRHTQLLASYDFTYLSFGSDHFCPPGSPSGSVGQRKIGSLALSILGITNLIYDPSYNPTVMRCASNTVTFDGRLMVDDTEPCRGVVVAQDTAEVTGAVVAGCDPFDHNSTTCGTNLQNSVASGQFCQIEGPIQAQIGILLGCNQVDWGNSVVPGKLADLVRESELLDQNRLLTQACGYDELVRDDTFVRNGCAGTNGFDRIRKQGQWNGFGSWRAVREAEVDTDTVSCTSNGPSSQWFEHGQGTTISRVSVWWTPCQGTARGGGGRSGIAPGLPMDPAARAVLERQINPCSGCG